MERKLFKKLFSMLLVLAMVLSMCPTFVFAEGTGGDHCAPCPHCQNTHIDTWTAWDGTGSSLASGHYYLQPAEGDTAVMTAQISIGSGKDVVIDLNGYTLQAKSADRAFAISGGGKLTIMDSSADETGRLASDGVLVAKNGGLIYMETAESRFYLYSGEITGGKTGDNTDTNRSGGNLYIASGKAYLYGGKVTNGYSEYRGGNLAAYGSSAYCYMLGDVQMLGGEAVNWGGSIYLTNTAKLIVGDNAEITGGKCGGSTAGGGNIKSMTGEIFVFGGKIEGTATGSRSTYDISLGASSSHAKLYVYGGTIGRVLKNTTSSVYQVYGGNIKTTPETVACEASTTATVKIDGVSYNQVTHTVETKVAPTCTAAGSLTHSCATCSHSYTLALEAAGHTLTAGSSATCGSAGYETYSCTDCDYFHECNKPLPATGDHTLVLSGDKTKYECSVCDHEEAATYCDKCETVPESEWQDWNGGELASGGHYRLTDDLALEEAISISSGKVCIDLGGHTITAAAGKRAFAVTGSSTHMTLMNGSIVATASETVEFDHGGLIYISSGTANLYKMTLFGGKTASGNRGGNIYATGADVKLTDCTIHGGSSYRGGNIAGYGTGTFVICGDTKIYDGTASYGNNLYTGQSVSLTVFGGEIGNAVASNDEDICLLSGSTPINHYFYGGTFGKVQVYGSKDYKANLYVYGGHIRDLEHTDSADDVITTEVVLYNATMSENPSTAGYNKASILAPCADYCKDGDVYKIWHKDSCTAHTAELDKVAAADKNSDIHSWQAATCTDAETCSKCGQTKGEPNGHEHPLTAVPQKDAVSCSEHGLKAYSYCSVCNAYFVDENGAEIADFAAWQQGTGLLTIAHDYTAETVKDEAKKSPVTCQNAETYFKSCSVCGAVSTNEEDVFTVGEQLAHSYNGEGICTNGCNALAGAKVTLGDTVTYYTTALEALVAANGTSATVCILKTATVTLKDTFNSTANALKNVTLSTAEGVTLKDNSGASSGDWYINNVTFAANSTFFLRGYMNISGSSTINIYGNVTAYMINVATGTLNVYGDQGGYLRNTGNFFISSSNNGGGHFNIYGNPESAEPVFVANEDATNYQIANYSGAIRVENAVISVGAILLSNQTDRSNFAPSFTAVNSTIIARNVKGTLDTTGENSMHVRADSGDFILEDSALQLAGTLTIVDGETVTLVGNSTITTTSADLQNSKIVAAEGVNGCVNYVDGVYTIVEHTAPNATCTEDGKCTNCGVVITEATGHTLSKTDAVEDTCTAVGNSAYWTCSTCGKFFSDAEGIVEINENDWIIDEVIDHAYGEDNVCDNGCGKTKCENNGHSMTFHAAEPSNCTEEGTIAHYNCSVCGKNFADEAGEEELNSIVDAADGHSMIFHAAEPSNCTEDGTIAYHHCSVCGKNFADEAGEEELNSIVDAADGHSHASEYHPATETENAYTVYTCHCGDTYTIVEEGTMLHVAVNQTTNESYTDLQAALDAAAKGQTVKLLKDTEAEDLYVGADKKLDLNGKKLTITSTVAASFGNTHIIDSSNSEGAMILAEGAEVALNTKNEQLPIWTDEGVKFAKVGYAQIVRNVANDAEAKKYSFYFTMTAADTILDTILTQSNNSVTIRIKVNYTTANGMNAYQYFELTDDMEVQYGTTWAKAQVNLILRGAVGMQNLVFTAEIVSTAPSGDTVVIGSTPYSA